MSTSSNSGPQLLLTLSNGRERLERRKSQVLPWISNPLHYFRRHLEQEEHGISHALRPSGLLFTERKLENAEEIEEATPIELFYDLFFVANLTTVTSIQHITQDKSSLAPLLLPSTNLN